MSRFKFLDNTPVPFVRIEDWNQLQTERNRLYKDYWYQGRLVVPFNIEFDSYDPFFFQYRTDYDNHDISIVYENGTTTTSYITKTLVKEYDNPDSELYRLKQYNVSIALSSLSYGNYYIRVACIDYGKAILNFRSEVFSTCASTLLKLEWNGSNILNDPFIWTINASLRLRADIKNITPNNDSSFYITTDGNRVVTFAQLSNARIFQIDLVPEYMVKLLERVTSHESFWINSVLFGRGEDWTWDIGKNIVYSPKITVIEKNYRNFTSDPELTGDLPPYEVIYRVINSSGDRRIISTGNNRTINT